MAFIGRSGFFRALALLAFAVFALVSPANAALNAKITITIQEIDCASACDGQGIEGIGDGPPDWYAKVFINNAQANPPRQDGPDDTAHIRPNWKFTQQVPATSGKTPVRIQIWDRDTFDDDLADDTPQPGDKNLDFVVDFVKHTVSGEVSGAIGQSICTFGNGEDSDGSVYLCFSVDDGDRDGDGLQDDWETNGIDWDGDGVVDLALNAPPFSANADHKDLFVEVDYMACSAGGCAVGDNHTHQPAVGALGDVIAAFAAAPVSNPDGTTGITLHAMQDEALADAPGILFQSNGPGTADDFNDIKNGNPAGACTGAFGTPAERGSTNCANILAAKRAVFQYAIFGHTYAEAPGSSGISELSAAGGNDLMVTLGGFSAAGIAAAGGQRAADASTFMHEFGHNLGLAHGGFEGKNCKPNYLSIMSYTLQFANIDVNRPMDYSRQLLSMLNETSLNESSGVGGPAGRNTVFGRGGNSVVGPAGGPIDWNGTGGSTESGVAADVDYISSISPGCNVPSPGDTNMQGYDDWQNLIYNFRSSTQYADGASRTSADELTNQTVVAMTPLADLTATKTVDRSTALPGDTLTYTVTARNNGPGKAVGVKITDSLPDGSTQVRNVGDLLANASSPETFTYVVPCNAADGSTVKNDAKVTGTNLALVDDPDASNNSASASSTVSAPKLVLSKVASATVNAGEAIGYSLTFENVGSGGAANVVVTDTLPADVYYSVALDQGAGPQPTSVAYNTNGTTTLTWSVGALPGASGPRTIEFTARPTLLALSGTSFTNTAGLTYQNANGCGYTAASASATTSITQVAPSRDPLTLGYWRNHPETWTKEVLARVQATDRRFDGADGSAADGRLTPAEVTAAFASPTGQPRTTMQQLLATYLNLASRRVNAGTAITSKTDVRLGLRLVRDAGLYAQGTLALPYNAATTPRYLDTTTVLDEINSNKSESY